MDNCELFGLALKVLSEGCVIGLETTILATKVIQTFNTSDSELNVLMQNESSNNSTLNVTTRETDSKTYKAYAYIAFYALALLVVAYYWRTIYVKKETPRGMAVLLASISQTPIIALEMSMLKGEGVISWEEQKYGLILQICFLLYVFIQTCFDVIYARRYLKLDSFSACIVTPASGIVITCVLYTPVMWLLAGWYGFERMRMSHIKGIITTEDAAKTLDILLFIGQVGQSLICMIIVCFLLWILVKCSCFMRKTLKK